MRPFVPRWPNNMNQTWYHATTCKGAEEIMKCGFGSKNCLKNRNFSDQDGIYFTDSIASAKHLFQHNAFIDSVVFPDSENKERMPPAEQKQYQIVVLAFNKKVNSLLEKYKNHSIDLRHPAHEERLKKIVCFFSKDPLPTSNPTIEEHGLESNYKDEIEYIIGPHVIISGPDVLVNRSVTQLCIRGVGKKRMLEDIEGCSKNEIYILDVDNKDMRKLN